MLLLNNKIQLSKSEDLIGFIQQVMNRISSHQANGKDLLRVQKRKHFPFSVALRRTDGIRKLQMKKELF